MSGFKNGAKVGQKQINEKKKALVPKAFFML